MEWKYKVASNGNTKVKYKYLKTVLKYSTWVNVLSTSAYTCNQSHGPLRHICSGETFVRQEQNFLHITIIWVYTSFRGLFIYHIEKHLYESNSRKLWWFGAAGSLSCPL